MNRKYLSGVLAVFLAATSSLESADAKGRGKSKKTQKVKRVYDRTFDRDSNSVLLARMLFGEGRGQTRDEKIAIAYTAVNRVHDGRRNNGETLREVILMPKQYSSFNLNDPNREKLLHPERYEPKAFKECLDVAKGVVSGKYKDPTDGATHYFSSNMQTPPAWASDMKRSIGRIQLANGKLSEHVFYRE